MPDTETHYGTLKKEHAYFAASNSHKGFLTYFDRIFRNKHISHLYIIKGGPGTGKSRFMREIASSAEAYGELVEYYYCSSDQSSLDGIIIHRASEGSVANAVAVIDGTAPHSFDTVLPGAREDIIDLGRFWNSDILSESADELNRLGNIKRDHYKKAYEYLSASHPLKKISDEILKPFVLFDKLEKYADEVTSRIIGRDAEVIPALIDSVGALGDVRYDSFSPFADKVLYVDDTMGVAYLLLDRIFDKALSKGADMKVSYDPVEPDEINALFINDGELAVIKCGKNAETEFDALTGQNISMRKFLSSDISGLERQKLRHLREMRSSLITLSLSELELAGRIHFDIESIYISAMDFSAKEKFSEEFRARLF